MCVWVYECVLMSMCVHVYVSASVFRRECVYVCMHICVCVYMCETWRKNEDFMAQKLNERFFYLPVSSQNTEDEYIYIYIYNENHSNMVKSQSTLVSTNGSSGLLWPVIWWNLGRLVLGYVGIIFIILTLSHELSTLLPFGLSNSVGVFPLD